MKTDHSISFLRRINFVTGLCFAALAVVYLITGIYSIVQSHRMQETNDEVTLACIEYADRQAGLEAGSERMQRHMVTAILAANEEARQSSLSEYNESVADLNKQLDSLEALMQNDNAEGSALVLSGLRESLTAYIDACDACISASNINRQVAFDMTLNNLPEPKAALDASFDGLSSLIGNIEEQGMDRSASMMRSSRNMTIGGIVAFLIVVVASVLIVVALVTAPLRRLSVELMEMIDDIHKKQGDLSRRIGVKSKNEIGSVVAGINEYVETLQGIMQKLKSNAESLSETSEAITAQMREANGSVDRSGDAMEQVSTTMRSVTDTAESISSGLKDVRASVEAMSQKTKEGSERASSVMQDAQRIRRDAAEKKENTGKRIEELNEVLKRSVENSEQVNKIGKLTDNILSIASQTNLLSLNASIEAARAGEAGRGFAVVAGEISSLADDSGRTAADIQSISESVTEAVRELSENATAVIDFISDVVLKDYDAFVETGDEYEQSVKSFNDMLKSLTENAKQLDVAMQVMDSAVGAIEESVDASARSLEAAENSAGEIAGSISDVNSLVETNLSISGALNHEVGRFARL